MSARAATRVPTRVPTRAASKAAPRATSGATRRGAAPVDVAHARDFGRRLRAWYRRTARDLPWRRTRDPYRVLLSELMLQQTQVARVVDFYAAFLSRFPTLRHVAEAKVHEVTGAWAGLGYYARARNLHALAQHVTADGGPGAIPAEPAALRALPGVGPYTAGAVASFAYERRAALVDTNVARVLRRVFAPDLEAGSANARALWDIAHAILPRTGRAAWTHNQALMELGALVCTARVRRCDACPVRATCATWARHGSPAPRREPTRASSRESARETTRDEKRSARGARSRRG